MSEVKMDMASEMIECKVCGHKGHILMKHLQEAHGMDAAAYEEAYPGAPVMSEIAKKKVEELKNTRNQKVKHNVRKLFGIKMPVEEMVGWELPWANTPKIDPDYVFGRELLNVILYCLVRNDQRLLSVGPTGSGKTSCYEQVFARLNLPHYKMSFDGEIGRSEFIGQWIVTGPNKMEFLYGILPRAMKEGACLILDEWDMMRDDLTGVLQPILEGGNLTILETGEVIKPHPDFRVFATANTCGSGDETGLYVGTNVQNFAARDRWSLCATVDYPQPNVESKIVLKKSGIEDFAKANEADPKKLIEAFLEAARLIRDAFVKGKITCTMSTRSIVNVATQFVSFGDMKSAWSLGYWNKLGSDDQKFVREIVQRVFGV